MPAASSAPSKAERAEARIAQAAEALARRVAEAREVGCACEHPPAFARVVSPNHEVSCGKHGELEAEAAAGVQAPIETAATGAGGDGGSSVSAPTEGPHPPAPSPSAEGEGGIGAVARVRWGRRRRANGHAVTVVVRVGDAPSVGRGPAVSGIARHLPTEARPDPRASSSRSVPARPPSPHTEFWKAVRAAGWQTSDALEFLQEASLEGCSSEQLHEYKERLIDEASARMAERQAKRGGSR